MPIDQPGRLIDLCVKSTASPEDSNGSECDSLPRYSPTTQFGVPGQGRNLPAMSPVSRALLEFIDRYVNDPSSQLNDSRPIGAIS